jgi:hypothetical protein
MAMPIPQMTLLGVLVAVVGVGIVTRAGQLKERKMGIKAEEVWRRSSRTTSLPRRYRTSLPAEALSSD